MSGVLGSVIEWLAKKIGVSARVIITILLAVVAFSMYEDFGWLTLVYLPIWVFLMYAYRDD